MYENIKAAIASHEAEMNAEFSALLSGKTCGDILNSWYLRERTTPKAFDALKKAAPDSIPEEWIIKKMIAKKAREESKNSERRLSIIAAAENAKDANDISVSVEWTRSRTWGANPHAAVRAYSRATYGAASGYGYDKESTAIAQAFNENPEVMKIVYNHAEKGGSFDYGIRSWGGVPYFEGGVGVSCYEKIFRALGFSWRCVASGKMYDAYFIEKEEN